MPEIWLVIMLDVAEVISGLMIFTHCNIPHALVLIWASIGIAVKFPENPTVSYSAWGAAALVALLLAIVLIAKPKHVINKSQRCNRLFKKV